MMDDTLCPSVFVPNEQDIVRIVTRNIGLFLGEASAKHESSGRYAENVVSWLLSRSPPAPRYTDPAWLTG